MKPKRYRDTDVWPDNWKEWTASLLLISVTLISVYVVIATGALTALTTERTVNVGIAGDARGILQLQPYDGPNGHPADGDPAYARINSNGQLELNMAGDFGSVWGNGVNINANTDIENVFTITNQGRQPVAVRLRKHDDLTTGENGEYANGEADAVLFYHTCDDGDPNTPETPLSAIKPRGSNYRYGADEFSLTAEDVELDPGESITVSMRIDTSVPSVANDNNVGDDLLDSITVIADSSATSEPNTDVSSQACTHSRSDVR